MIQGFTFADYNLRPVTEADRDHCAKWIEADPDHRGRVLPGYFIMTMEEQMKQNIECFLLENKNGEPEFYFRISRALRLDIQFGPATTPEEKVRLMAALHHGFNWLFDRASASGYRQIIFESENPALVRFCTKRFGFQRSPTELVRAITAPQPQTLQEKGLQG